MAARRGYRRDTYWIAFGSSFAASLLISVALPIVLLLGLLHSVSTANQYSLPPPTSPASPSGGSGASGDSAPSAVSGSASYASGDSYTTSPSTDYIPPATSPTTAFDSQTAELQQWVSDPNKCGPQPTDQGEPWSASHTYQITATIHLWSDPTTSSTPLGTIVVENNGPGGVGCASGADPTVTVACTVQGQPITGPFGSDKVWDRVTWNGQSGYVSDEWVDTKWDVNSLPGC